MSMVIGIFGENCVGKSTLANKLSEVLNAEIYSGKDYLRLGKNEANARQTFIEMLNSAMTDSHIIYVVSEKDQLGLLPEMSIRVLMTADLAVIKERFAARMNMKELPKPLEMMLERKHGQFDHEKHNLHFESGKDDLENMCKKVLDLIAS